MPSPQIIVVTGTDTGVGKTWVSRSLGLAAARKGIVTVGIKPIESGCNGEMIEDGVLLAQATGQAQPDRALLRLVEPVAPPVAAEKEDVALDFDQILHQTRDYANSSQLAIVEGAGGLLSPLSWQHTTLSLAQQLKASVLLVASNTLGVINHCLLTINMLEQHNIPLVGVVFSEPESTDVSVFSNRQSLLKMSPNTRALEISRARTIEESADELGPVLAWLGSNGSI